MFLYLLLLLTLVPIIELALLFRIAAAIDWIPTIALVLVTGVVGAGLARREGLKTFAQIQTDLSAGKMPAAAMVEGVLILAAGLVLITPGVVTDAFGLFLLIPPCRRWLGGKLSEKFQRHVVIMHHGDFHDRPNGDDGFIDVEVTGAHTEDFDVRLDQPGQNDNGGGQP